MMNSRGLWWALLICFPLCHMCPAQQESELRRTPQLESDLSRVRQAFPGQMAIYMKNLANGEEIALDADAVYETFSVIKLAIAAEALHQVETGKFSLADRVTVKASDRRLPSGVLWRTAHFRFCVHSPLISLCLCVDPAERRSVYFRVRQGFPGTACLYPR